MSLPTMTGIGRLIEEPTIKLTANSTFIGTVRLAFNARKKNEAGEWVNGDTFYVTGTAFNDMAEHINASLAKGDEVIVTGRLRTREYTDKQENKRSVTDLTIDSIGPTLRWSDVKIARMARKSKGETDEGDHYWDTATQSKPGEFVDAPPF